MKFFVLIFFLFILLNFSNVFCEEYKVETGDVLTITVYEQQDLTTKTRVDANGNITFPLLGSVRVGGFTISEVERQITDLLKADYLVNPQVNVFIETYHPKKVFVMGFINKPGEYELSKDRETTVLEAITMAGGFKEGAAQNGTKVIRVKNGEKISIPIRVMDITSKGDKAKDIPVKPGDIIVVPESFF